MRLEQRLPWSTPLLALLLLPACEKSTAPADPATESSQEPIAAVESNAAAAPFDAAQVFFEVNTTDDDMGFQVFLDAEGWQRVNLIDPRGRRVFGIQADEKLAEIGITELRFESAEPSPAEVRSRFPAGEYTFRGETVDGAMLASKVNLSQRMLPAPSFTPRNGQVVDPTNLVVRWNAPGAEMVEVIIEHDDLGHVLDVTVAGSTDRLTIPRQFLRPGKEYKIEILSIAENGNRTIAESTFRTRE
jgi:hypothetical protein